VPFCVVGCECKLKEGGTLADIAPTMLEILEIEKPAEMTGSSRIL
jgi:2,3-bisphosphoglycerate-independent phosphoglycerate mutase